MHVNTRSYCWTTCPSCGSSRIKLIRKCQRPLETRDEMRCASCSSGFTRHYSHRFAVLHRSDGSEESFFPESIADYETIHDNTTCENAMLLRSLAMLCVEDLRDAVVDVLADLEILSRRFDLPFEDLARTAHEHFVVEIEAFEERASEE